LQRRAGYDNGLKMAVQMALSIGGLRGVFGGISLDSFDQGALDFEFAERGVFVTDKLDEYEEEEFFWKAAKTAREAGMPLLAFLEHVGWDEEKLAKLRADPELQAKQDMLENMDTFGGDSEDDEE